MGNIRLTYAGSLYDRVLPLYTGEVQPEGIDLDFIRIEQPRPIFDRMSGGEEFDIAEYSTSEFVQRYAAGQCNFVAIPVFPTRCFRHSFIAINKASGITSPKDLENRRIGVALYTMTAAVYIRGMLQDDYGVDLSCCTWVQGAINTSGAHGAPTVLPLLKPVNLEQGPADKSLDDLIQSGAVDATMGTSVPASYRSNPNIARLFPDFVEQERDWYARTNIYPIMHLVAIKKSVHEKYPFVASSLFKAFQRSKEIALERMFNLRALRYMLPWMTRDVDEVFEYFDGDPWPYGIEPNRPTLEAMVRYMQEQHLTDWQPSLEELFVPTYGLE
ncbi:ABC transporter substrate-binding protein [Oceanicola sp. D3]|uniref:ABC transporter substrate-binding protein n=1 Tax=Oceanicola sp. D3 TaxID=2587163 RepID=UPI001123E1B7|nr:ABC transporter substrate-binding protein [Oceanicola sp. D3]QDC08614.1 ABC transporter substrate-binding protein [Oceanicola sp. D3]